MTTFFLDFEGGNDANAGTSFALRWKTLTTGATAARTAPGDTIRMMGSPAPTSLGQNATWTDGSDTVTLTSAVTADIDAAASAWTASANVTAAVDATNYKEGAQSVSLAIAAGFTTGLVGYKATGALNLAAYQQISFWIRSTGAHAAGVFQLKLCSDVAGATPVNTVDIPALSGNGWFRVTVDTAGNLGASIQSVALYAVSDPATVTVLIDNIIACKASASADSLTLDSLISPQSANDEPWYCINSIRGTTIKLGNYIAATGGTNGKYYGESSPSATVQLTYKREAIKLTSAVTQYVGQESGTIGNEIAYVGGYNRTDMSTQDGVTWVRPADGTVGFGAALLTTGQGGAVNHISYDKMYFANCNARAIWPPAGLVTLRLKEVGGAGGSIFFDAVNSSSVRGGVLIENLTFCTGFPSILQVSGTSSTIDVRLRAKKLYYGPNTETSPALEILSNGYGGTISGSVDEIKGFSSAAQTLYAGLIELFGTTFKDNVIDANTINVVLVSFGGLIRLINPTFASGDIALSASNNAPVEIHGANGVQTDQRYYYDGKSTGPCVLTATDQRHTASDISWKFATGNVAEQRKMERPIARAAVAANTQVSITLWAYRDQTYVNGRLLVRPYLPGIAAGGVYVDMTQTSAWEQLLLQFTPTVAGVFEVVFQTWATSASAGNVWIDDTAIIQ